MGGIFDSMYIVFCIFVVSETFFLVGGLGKNIIAIYNVILLRGGG